MYGKWKSGGASDRNSTLPRFTKFGSLYSPHETLQHPDRWWEPSGAEGRTGGRSHEPPLCSLHYSEEGGWERMLVSATDRHSTPPLERGPAVSISSLATCHLLLISSYGNTEAFSGRGTCTIILRQIRPCVFSLLLFKWKNMQELNSKDQRSLGWQRVISKPYEPAQIWQPCTCGDCKPRSEWVRLSPDEGAWGLDAVDDGVLVVGEQHRGLTLNRIHRQLHRLLGENRVRRRLTGQHVWRQADGEVNTHDMLLLSQ